MSRAPRFLVATASVCVIAVAVFAAIAWGPRATRGWLLIPALTAIALAVSSAAAEPRELLPALVLGAAPAMGLAAPDAHHWLMAPAAVLLLVGAELNAWSWELAGRDPTGPDHRRRIVSIARTAGVGLVAALGVSLVARSTLLDGLAAVALASAGLAALAWMILPATPRRESPSVPSDEGPASPRP